MSELKKVDTVVVGAGHAGLAVSRLLTDAGREHVVLDRGGVGHRWRTERWDSLTLLTPSWMTRLPGWYTAGDPDRFLSAREFRRHLERYAVSFGAPVVPGTTVRTLTDGPGGYRLHTDHGTWQAGSVVVATGPHGTPVLPPGTERAEIPVVTSNRYRNPQSLAPGGVLVVGASSSGVQIADELVRSGRDVVLAVGRHTRMPRRYRGMDVFWWLEATGRLARTIDEVPDREAARREPSIQLVGRAATAAGTRDFGDRGPGDLDLHDRGLDEVDLAALRSRGVRLVGRLCSVEGRVATFADNLASSVVDADRRMHRFLDSVDRYVETAGLAREVWPTVRPGRLEVDDGPARLDLAAAGITTIVVAAGFRPDHRWIELPVTTPDGSIRQHRGVTEAPGLYVVGQRFQHRRDSGFIDGARHDARAVVSHLTTGVLPRPTQASTTVTHEEQP